ncbi:MAG: hypothetical protein RBU25_19825 [Lentisphaeria bacterium]|jgi:hypothetical protein|nr:hypothetical protein [Lentisphaeria bacterium]
MWKNLVLVVLALLTVGCATAPTVRRTVDRQQVDAAEAETRSELEAK